MSNQPKIEDNQHAIKTKFENICKNFINMLNQEKSDSMKLNYFSALENSAKKSKLPPKMIIEIIFQKILFEKDDIIKSPNLLLAFVSFCRQLDELIFQKNFYELLYKFVSKYDDNYIYFKNYLIMLSLEIFFESVEKSEDNEEDIDMRKKYFNQIMHTDIKEFQEQFIKFIINSNMKLMDNKIKYNFILDFLQIIRIKSNYQIGILLLKLIKEEIKSNFPDDMIEKLILLENKTGFNLLIDSKKNLMNGFLTYTQYLLSNISQDFIYSNKNENFFDFYFSNILNILCINNEFNIELIKYIFEYYKNKKTKILSIIFPEVIYHLSAYAYTNNQISFLFNTICQSDEINPIYKRIIYKNPILFKKTTLIKTNFKPSLENIKVIIELNEENDEKEDDIKINSIIDHILFINKEESNIYLLIYLTLYNYIINSSLKFKENNYIINYHSLNKILQLISKTPIENIPDNYSNFLLQFLLDYFSVIFELSLTINDKSKFDLILKTFQSFFNLFKKIANKPEKQLSIIFPSLINQLNKNIKIELSEPILNYLIETFARKTRQCDMIFKSIKSILINSDKNNFENKFFLADKLVSLVIESNEHKSFESLFSFSNELLKDKDKNIFNQNLGQYIINKYSKFYVGMLSDLLQRDIITRFDEKFLQKKFSIEEIGDEEYNIINTLDNIYSQDKPENLVEIVDKFYGDEYKKIMNIFDQLFEFMNKNENNINVFISDDGENIIDKYLNMKNNLNNICDFYSFIKLNYSKNNDFFIKNKKILQIYGISYYLAHLLNQYLIGKIINEKNIENEEEKKIENDKLMIIFNYIYEKIMLNKEIKNNYFKSFFINSLLSNQELLNYYFEKYTNFIVNEEIKKKELDFSKLRELSANLNHKKSLLILELLKCNPFNIVLMKQLILELFTYESDAILNPKKVDLYDKNSKKYYIIKNINTNKLIPKLNEKNLDKNKFNKNTSDNDLIINSCFSKLFFDLITDLSKKENLESNQLYYLFCLDNDIFYLYYNSFNDFYDYDLTILELYSLIRNKNCSMELKEKFFEFLKKFNFIESILVFNLRVFSEDITFNKLIDTSNYNISEKMISLLCDIIIYLLNNLLKYNSYQNYAENIISNIIHNVFKFTKDILLFKQKEKINEKLNYLGKLINYILEKFSNENNNFTNKPLPKNSEFPTNINLIKNINKIIDEKYNPNNPKISENIDNKELFKFIKQLQENDIDNKYKNVKDIYKFMEDDAIICDYSNNPTKYPFPIIQFMDKYGFNKKINNN